MTRHHLINGVRVDFTAEEETAWDNAKTAYDEGAPGRALAKLRHDRNRLLAQTDFYALSDVTMSSDMATYRQALRDLPAGKDTVKKVNDATWPTKP